MSNLISSIFKNVADIRIIGTATTYKEALDQVEKSDVVLISTRMPNDSAMRLTQLMSDAYPQVNVLMLGLAESRAEVIQYIEAGAAGYVLQDDSVEDMLEAIRAAQNEAALVSPEIAAALMSRINELAQLFTDTSNMPKSPDLTPREREVLELVGQGLTNKQIADQLVIQVGTVKNHVHSILDKLDVDNRHDAATFIL
jgi:DNA-binding NarL/FixJ family response regulator